MGLGFSREGKPSIVLALAIRTMLHFILLLRNLPSSLSLVRVGQKVAPKVPRIESGEVKPEASKVAKGVKHALSLYMGIWCES